MTDDISIQRPDEPQPLIQTRQAPEPSAPSAAPENSSLRHRPSPHHCGRCPTTMWRRRSCSATQGGAGEEDLTFILPGTDLHAVEPDVVHDHAMGQVLHIHPDQGVVATSVHPQPRGHLFARFNDQLIRLRRRGLAVPAGLPAKSGSTKSDRFAAGLTVIFGNPLTSLTTSRAATAARAVSFTPLKSCVLFGLERA